MVRWPSEAVDRQPVPTASDGHRTKPQISTGCRLFPTEGPLSRWDVRRVGKREKGRTNFGITSQQKQETARQSSRAVRE